MSMNPQQPQLGQQPRNPRAEAKVAKAYAKATRPWFEKKRWWGAALIVVLIAAVAAGSGGTDSPTPVADDQAATAAPASDAAVDESGGDEEPATDTPELTTSQENAVESAKNYIELTPLLSHGGDRPTVL